MCGGNEEHTWRKEPPDSPGEWAWLVQWDCGCVHRYGLAWVVDPNDEYGCPDGLIEIPNGLRLSWSGQRLHDATIDDVLWWKKEIIPPGHDGMESYRLNKVGYKPKATVKTIGSMSYGTDLRDGIQRKTAGYEANESARVNCVYESGLVEIEFSDGRRFAVYPTCIELVQNESK